MEQSLTDLANCIPSMGGREIGPALREFARVAQPNTAIVEVGCWLGAGTAQLALGILENNDPTGIKVHCYDRWTANEAEIAKAARKGVHLDVGEDLLPHARRMLERFSVPIAFHQGEIITTAWNDGPISIYVDDAAKVPRLFYHALRTFGPSWIPGETIIFLMDFDIWKKTGKMEHQCQKAFIEAHEGSFERIERPGLGTKRAAIFRYRAAVDFMGWIISRFESEAKDLAKEAKRATNLKDELKQLKMEKRELESEFNGLNAALRDSEEKLRQVRGSVSWRITAPLRRVRHFFMRAPRRG